MLDTLRDTIVTQNINGCAEATKAALDAGLTGVEIINSGISVGMKIIGDEFEAAEVYLPQIMVCKGYDLIQEQIGVDAISVDQNVDAAAAVANVEKAVIVGNLDPVNMLWNQTPETIEEQSQKVIDAGIGLLGPGCGIVSKTPNANLQAMIEVAKNHKY